MYEANPVLGGMTRYGVPDFRLPRDVVDREIGWILEVGVRARVNTVVGRDISFADVRAAHDAVIVATGTPRENSRIPSWIKTEPLPINRPMMIKGQDMVAPKLATGTRAPLSLKGT